MVTKVTKNMLSIANKGGLLVGNGSGAVVEKAVGTNDQTIVADSAEEGGFKWAARVGGGYRSVQRFLSGSGTYTTAANVTSIRIRMSGGGSSGSTAVVQGNAGSNTTFSTLTAGGGAAPPAGNSSAAQGAGGTASGGSVLNAPGGQGQIGNSGVVGFAQGGGSGGTNPLGGSGAGGVPTGAATDGQAGQTNTGAGGGGGSAVSGGTPGYGGNAGGYIEHIITSPDATYSYGVGAGGASVAGGASGGASGAGAAGIIIVEEAI